MLEMKRAWRWFLEALFPLRCLVCGREGDWLCSEHALLRTAPQNKAKFYFVDAVYAPCAYKDPLVKKIVERFKFFGLSGVVDLMVDRIIEQEEGFFPEGDCLVVPVPLHWRRYLWRGYNQAGLLARGIATKMPQASYSSALKRSKATQQQAKLTAVERLKNIQDAFIWRGESLRGKTVVLVDDVVASGATLDAAAKTLKQAGAVRVLGCSFARSGKL